MTGESDGIVPPSFSERLARELPNAELHVLKECGHVPQEECPEQFLAVVRAFLSRLGPNNRKHSAQ